MPSPRYILAGGSGLLGQAVGRALEADGADVVVLSRSPRQHSGAGRAVQWDAAQVDNSWLSELDGSAGVVNFTGRNVNTRWTAAAKREIRESRLNSTRVIGEAIGRCQQPPPVSINPSGVSIYGDRGDEILTEQSPLAPPGEDFLADVCRDWEEAATSAQVPPGVRRVILRIGVVLSDNGGALPLLARVTRLFAGGRLGSGRQWMPWLHVEDLVGIVRRALEGPDLAGVVHATAPNPVRNSDLMRELRRILGRPPAPPAPAWAARIGGKLLGLPIEPALASVRAIPSRLADEGFPFQYSQITAALEACLRGRP